MTLALSLPALADGLTLQQDNTVISQSCSIRPGVVIIPDAADDGAVQIVGDNLVVDFAGATLVGSPDSALPDSYAGRGIVIRGKNVTVKNAVVRGYKVGIYAENSEGVRLENCDVSRNYRQRLKSTPQAEQPDDWLYGHENDQNEWLRYGSGIYLFKSPKARVQNCRSRNGQNGICLVRCDESVIIDNDMSFMSGWGLAMWRSSRCEISHNKFDWCIRGYSHGVYSRGQDSAGILVYEQCNDNVFAYNSATHGGDGFFLYAGNETLNKTGIGGCNRNWIYKNDFSHAAANGIEATFSEFNTFFDNILDECDHGIWAGYSSNSNFAGNKVTRCRNGISIEHGHDNVIGANEFDQCNLGVHLWWDEDPDLLNTVFGKTRTDCPSRDNQITLNEFQSCKTAIRLDKDRNAYVWMNRTLGSAIALEALPGTFGGKLELNEWEGGRVVLAPGAKFDDGLNSEMKSKGGPDRGRDFLRRNSQMDREEAFKKRMTLRGTMDAFLKASTPRGRDQIFVDEWGPYDFSGPKVYPTYIVGGRTVKIQVLGPSLPFTTHDPSSSNLFYDRLVEPKEGVSPNVLTVTSDSANAVMPFGFPVIVGGQKFFVSGVLNSLSWTVKHFAWNDSSDPRTQQDKWDELLAGTHLCDKSTDSLDFAWGGGGPCEGGPVDHFGTLATARFTLPEGRWRIKTISDDGIRVWVNGMRLIDEWTWHGPTEYSAEFDATVDEYDLRVEHFEIDGWSQLQLFIEPASADNIK